MNKTTEEEVTLVPGDPVKVESINGLFKGIKLGIVIGKCKGTNGWIVHLINPDSATKEYCISAERGDTIVRITK